MKYIELQKVVDECGLKHASLELIVSLLHQMYAFAIREDVVEKDVSKYVKINIPDDDEHGVRISDEDIEKLWHRCDDDYAKAILIYIYTGWRLTELLDMPKSNIDLINMIITSGKKHQPEKTESFLSTVKYRILCYTFIINREIIFLLIKNKPLSKTSFRKNFDLQLQECEIIFNYTPHDCRHTFESKLDDAGVNQVIKDRLIGHASKSPGEKIYTRKTTEQLREAIEKS